MFVYIVIKNDKLDEVFDNLPAAIAHRDNLIKKWNIARVEAREVRSI